MTTRSADVQTVVRACEIVKAFRHKRKELLLSDLVERATFVKHQLLTPKYVDLIYLLDLPDNKFCPRTPWPA